MSFWPFSNSLNNNSKLQKFLDSVQDPSAVSVEDLVSDSELSSELISELHNIKGNYGKNASNFPFSQQLQQQQQQLQSQLPLPSQESLSLHLQDDDHALTPVSNNNNNNSNNAETASVSSYSETNNSSLSKDARGLKLIEILIQPHILNGFLDYIVESVVFFHDLSQEEEKKLEKLVSETADPTEKGEEEEDDGEENSTGETSNGPQGDVQHEEDTITANGEISEDVIDEEHEEDIDEEESSEEKLRRYIQVSSDVLSIDLWIISNRIIETPVIISKLWSILSLPNLSESSPSVSYLVHILDQLMDANSIELLNFVRRQPDLVDTFLDKIDIPMLMDFFLRIIQTDKVDSPTGILETLSSQHLIKKLIEILKPQDSQFEVCATGIANSQLFFKQTAATDFIKALITISSNTALAINLETNIGPNQLTRELVSEEIIKTIMEDIILYRPPPPPESSSKATALANASNWLTNKHGISNCVGIIIEIIRKNNSDYDSNCGTYSAMLNNGDNGGANGGAGEVNSYVMFQWLKDFEQNPPGIRDPIYLGEMLEIFSDHLGDLSELMHATAEDSKELGFTNFKISELIAELLHCSNMILLNSKKIKKVIKVREYVRSQQSKRLKRAINESILSESDAQPSNPTINGLDDVTHGLDDVSLDNISIGSKRRIPPMSQPQDGFDLDAASIDDATTFELANLANEGDIDSEDEEPVISPENPFVGADRDTTIRANPCIGDKFKIDLVDSGILQQIIHKFTEYPWHNFFHNVVFDLIQQIFNGKLNSYNSFLIVELFKKEKCNLTGIIHDAYRHEVEPRPGYMGHLILISEEIVKFTSLYKPDLISPIIVLAVASEEWEWFVNDVLLKTREVYNAVLGSDQGFEDEDEDEGEGANRRKGRTKNGGDDDDDDDDVFGFDSSTIGYLDLESYDHRSGAPHAGDEINKIIVLGDKDNHESFINDTSSLTGEEEDDELLEETHLPDVSMAIAGTPKAATGDDNIDEDDGEVENEFLENLSGSSSSEEDEDAGVDGVAAGEDEELNDNNELRRVPKHNS